MTIANLIRKYLEMKLQGAYSEDIHNYCIENGAKFRVANLSDQLMIVSG